MRVERGLRGLRRCAAGALLLAATAAGAQGTALPAPAKAAVCGACHGADGHSPSPAIPSLAAQPRLYLENTLVLIRDGLREVPAMREALAGASDEEIIQLAKHYAALPPKPAAEPKAAQPALLQRGAQLAAQLHCGSCHRADYSGQAQVPRLAGQHEAWLLASMLGFRDRPGPGRDTIMAATLRGLSDADLGALAHAVSRPNAAAAGR